jgi:hypothetical protein
MHAIAINLVVTLRVIVLMLVLKRMCVNNRKDSTSLNTQVILKDNKSRNEVIKRRKENEFQIHATVTISYDVVEKHAKTHNILLVTL